MEDRHIAYVGFKHFAVFFLLGLMLVCGGKFFLGHMLAITGQFVDSGALMQQLGMVLMFIVSPLACAFRIACEVGMRKSRQG